MKYSKMKNFSCKSQNGRTIEVSNTNSMLFPENAFYNSSITGLKTGHTTTAGRCICVSYDDGVNKLIVLMFRVKKEASDSYSDTYYRNKNVKILIDYFVSLA